MIYHLTEHMKKVLLERLEIQNIKVDLKKPFHYNGYLIDLNKETIECIKPVKCIVK